MDFWIACLLLLTVIAGIIFVSLKIKKKERKTRYIIEIVCLGIVALLLIAYIMLTMLFIVNIP